MKALLLTCEHAGNVLSEDVDHLFRGHEDIMLTHRAYDIGAFHLFEQLLPLAKLSLFNVLSRLVVDLNRSEHHPRLFSEFSKAADPRLKQSFLDYHHQYWNDIKDLVNELIRTDGEVVHVAVHSFTPVLDGKVREVDIGLLYDPARPGEKAFCTAWGKAIEARMPSLRVRMNQPYKGVSDGLPTALRKAYPTGYIGVELEVNQRFAPADRMHRKLVMDLRDSLSEVLRDGW